MAGRPRASYVSLAPAEAAHGSRMTEPSAEFNSDFDAHHQLQGAMIDAFEAALLAGESCRRAAETLGHLVDFTAVHFLEEERFMETRGFPEAEAHRSAHATLLAEIRSLEATARQGGAERALAGAQRLRTWLLDHVKGEDARVAEWRRGRPDLRLLPTDA